MHEARNGSPPARNDEVLPESLILASRSATMDEEARRPATLGKAEIAVDAMHELSTYGLPDSMLPRAYAMCLSPPSGTTSGHLSNCLT
jgi:hypothetical protein